jgi:threonine/homoserine/homoserine lactone efflux protein
MYMFTSEEGECKTFFQILFVIAAVLHQNEVPVKLLSYLRTAYLYYLAYNTYMSMMSERGRCPDDCESCNFVIF